jgi:cyclophilin family peptidyl-prolyl cis-trans isomerase/HEAT repeat protein
MKKNPIIYFVAIVCFSLQIFGQVSGDKEPVQVFIDKQALKRTFVRIVKAEDELRFDEVLEGIIEKGNPLERERAALAAGRIGDEKAIAMLVKLTETDGSAKVRETAVFALGEIESIKGADAVLAVLKNKGFPNIIRARAIEATGKIAAANPKDEKSKELGQAILDILEDEDKRGEKQSKDIILLGITAALRAKAEETDYVVAKFLTNLDARIRADAANTLARLRTKNANEKFRSMLLTDDDPIARANAARGLGIGEDKEAVNMLIESAITDEDSRVRVSAIRSLGSLKDEKSAEKLLERGDKLLADYKTSKSANPVEKNELLEIATALGNILKGKNDKKATEFLSEFLRWEVNSPEIYIAIAKVTPDSYLQKMGYSLTLKATAKQLNWLTSSSEAQGKGELADNTDKEIRKIVEDTLRIYFTEPEEAKKAVGYDYTNAIPDLLRSFAKFKTEDLSGILRKNLIHKDIFIRAAAAELLGEQTAAKENIEALKAAFANALKTDKTYNDAQLSILSALVKLDKQQAVESLKLALDAPDFLVRKHAANLIKENDLAKNFPNLEEKVGTVKPYNAKTGTKLGQILNTELDYKRAVSRENGKVQAVLTTEKGKFTIELLPENAPLTVDNFIKLAKSRYFNNVAFHRIVPNFVVQDGDPRGDGNGGPGYSIRDEMNTVPYERGVVGMALSGKNTGGSQWFVTHSPQPHLDGGYTVFGRVNETDMKIVDMLVRGDKILKVEIIEGNSAKKK